MTDTIISNEQNQMSSIEERVIKIITGILEIQDSEEVIDINQSLINLRINSISMIKIIVDIENEFDVEFEDQDLDIDRFENLKSLVLYISDRLSNDGKQ
jgi:acyl carrier protein